MEMVLDPRDLMEMVSDPIDLSLVPTQRSRLPVAPSYLGFKSKV